MGNSPMKIQHSEPYGPLRAKAYPPITDQLDAIMKFAVAVQQWGVVLPVEVTTWIAKCQAVKAKYPKH